MTPSDYSFLLGGSTNGPGSAVSGLRQMRLDADGTPHLGPWSPVGENPMFLTHVTDQMIAVVHETADGHISLHVNTYGGFQPVGEPAPTHAADPCHITATPDGSAVLVANYGGGTLTVHPVTDRGLEEPSLTVAYGGHGPDPGRQAAAHPHQAVVHTGRGIVLVPDLGTDSIHVHRLTDLLAGYPDHTDIQLAEGSGPRHLVVDGDHTIVANELDRTVTAVDIGTRQVLATVHATKDPGAASAPGTSGIRLTQSGHVIVANRGPGTIGVLKWDRGLCRLEFVDEHPCSGVHPRDIETTLDDRFVIVANQWSDQLAVLELSPETGHLTTRAVHTPVPSCRSFA